MEIDQTRGPTIEFTGRLIASTQFETRSGRPLKMEFEIWESQGGALVAMSAGTPIDGDGYTDCRALVVPACDDAQAMHLAVMDFFNWEDRARSMVRKQLDWDLRVEVP